MKAQDTSRHTMAQRDVFKDFIYTIGLNERDPLVLSWIDDINMRTAIPLSIYTLLMERFMYNRTVMLWGLISKRLYNLCFIVLAFCSVQLFITGVLFVTKKVHKPIIGRLSMNLYILACFTVGQLIAIYDYAIGKQVFIFLPMVAWIFALVLLHPVFSIAGAVVSFLIIPEYNNSRIVLSNYVDRILMLFAFMMVVISIVRWIDQLRSARASIKLNVMNDTLSEISMRDELTGAKNRYALRQDYPLYRDQNLMVLMLDIDDFKYYNDTYGHETGDDVLKHMSKTLVKHFGKGNVYRFGGDEFLIVLLDTSEEEVLKVIKDWKADFHVFVYEDKVMHLSSTVGYTWGRSSSDKDLRQMVSMADTCLYEGKTTHKGTSVGKPFLHDGSVEDASLDQLKSNLRTGEMDALTKLPNMLYFRSKADISTDVLRESGKEPVLAYLNLSKFKNYNRRKGFEAGDTLLMKVGDLLLETFKDDLVCRFADDHFTVITAKEGIEEKIHHLNESVEKLSGDSAVFLQAGLYELRETTNELSLACDCARQALQAIRGSKTICRWYDDEMRKILEEKQYITDHLHEALENHWIEVIYQPIIRSVNKMVCGMEALPRWNDPEHGVFEPEKYVPILEEASMIFDHDMYVLNTAVDHFIEFVNNGHTVVPIVINLSYRDLEQDDLVDRIVKITEPVDRSMIHFDIGASTFGNISDYMEKNLKGINEAGYQLWMDGFGGGNSMVDVLLHYKMHGVKIDIRSIDCISDESSSGIFLSHIISMCKELNIATLALGVENQEEETFLKFKGCEYLQGFWFSPMVTYAQCYDSDFSRNYKFEPISQMGYYEAIGHIDLSRPTRVGVGSKLNDVTEELPAAVCEGTKDGHFSVIRHNTEFLPFLQSIGIPSIDVYEQLMNRKDYDLNTRLTRMCFEARTTDDWVTMLLGNAEKYCTGSFRVLSENRDTGSFAVLGVIVDMRYYSRH